MNAQLRQAIFEAIGEASMCWSNIDKAGVFESTRAQDIGERLVKTLAVPKEIKFEWAHKTGSTVCLVNGLTVGCVWYNGVDDRYMAEAGNGTRTRHDTEPEARTAVEDAFRVWLGGVYGM